MLPAVLVMLQRAQLPQVLLLVPQEHLTQQIETRECQSFIVGYCRMALLFLRVQKVLLNKHTGMIVIPAHTIMIQNRFLPIVLLVPVRRLLSMTQDKRAMLAMTLKQQIIRIALPIMQRHIRLLLQLPLALRLLRRAPAQAQAQAPTPTPTEAQSTTPAAKQSAT